MAELPPELAGSVVMLGMVSEADKASLLRSVDVYVAPNTGGESFGIILLEAMAARTPDRGQRPATRSGGCCDDRARAGAAVQPTGTPRA